MTTATPILQTAPRHGLGREIAAGLNVLTISLPMGSAAGVIAYAPLGPDRAALGAVAGLVSAAVGGILISLLRSNTAVVMTAASSAASVQASGVAIALSALPAGHGATAAALPLIALATGLFQILLGLAGAGRLVKFVPFPVVSGFVSGVGLLLVLKFSPALFGTIRPSAIWAGGQPITLPDPTLAAFTGALLAFAFAAQRWLPRGLPVALVACLVGIALYQSLAALGFAGPLGGTLEAGAVRTLAASALAPEHWGPDLLAIALDREALIATLLGAATVALVSLLETVFATRAAQSVAEFPSAPRRDMVGLGVGSAVTAAFGAVALSASAAQTMVNYLEGGRSRLSTLAASGTLLVILLAVPAVLSLVPLCIFPPLIMFVGWRLIDPYTGAILRGAATRVRGPARAGARRDALVHLSVLLPTALNLPLMGVATGIALSCCIFILSMSRPVVRRVRDGRTVSSLRVRSLAETETLAAHCKANVVVDLEGTLFFANSEDLAVAVKAQHGARFVTLVMRGVTDVDATGARILEQTRRSLAASGVTLLAAEATATIASTIARLFPPEHLFADLDDALEYVEDALLADHRTDPHGARGVALDAFDLCAGASAEGLAVLQGLLREERHAAGAILCREGEPADRIWLIRSGGISVRVRRGAVDRRIAAFGAGTTVGEMAVIEGKSRSASLVADDALDLYVLDLDAYRHIVSDEPQLATVLFTNLARNLSHRLRTTSIELRAAGG